MNYTKKFLNTDVTKQAETSPGILNGIRRLPANIFRQATIMLRR